VNWIGKSNMQPYISKNGLSLYFMSGRPGGVGNFDIWVSQRASVDDEWGEPINPGSNVNSTRDEYGPALSPDEHTLYFASDRPGGHGAFDIYASRRRDRTDDLDWRPAVNLPGEINTAADERGPAPSDDDPSGMFVLFFQSGRLGGADIFVSPRLDDGTFGAASLVTLVSSSSSDNGPFVTRDGREMYFSSNRPGGIGGNDLWVSTRASIFDPWSDPVNLGSVVNSPLDDNNPALSFDGTELYFMSINDNVPTGKQHLYMCLRTKVRGGGTTGR
jgi:Tol biopolymer transport system component